VLCISIVTSTVFYWVGERFPAPFMHGIANIRVNVGLGFLSGVELGSQSGSQQPVTSQFNARGTYLRRLPVWPGDQRAGDYRPVSGGG